MTDDDDDDDDDILDTEDAPWLSMDGELSRCKVIDVYDCDTVTLLVVFGGKVYKKRTRLANIDSAEIRTRNLDEKKFGLDSKKWLSDKIMGKKLWVRCGDWDKYGRLLGELFEDKECLISINDEIVKNGYAYYYDGGKRKGFHQWYDTNQLEEQPV